MSAVNNDLLETFLEREADYKKVCCRDCDGCIDKYHTIYYRPIEDTKSLLVVVHRWKGFNNESFFAAEIRYSDNPAEDFKYVSYGDIYSKFDLGDALLMRSQLEYAICNYFKINDYLHGVPGQKRDKKL